MPVIVAVIDYNSKETVAVENACAVLRHVAASEPEQVVTMMRTVYGMLKDNYPKTTADVEKALPKKWRKAFEAQ